MASQSQERSAQFQTAKLELLTRPWKYSVYRRSEDGESLPNSPTLSPTPQPPQVIEQPGARKSIPNIPNKRIKEPDLITRLHLSV